MSFEADTVWPKELLAVFKNAHTSRGFFDNQYFGPYTRLLSYCFSGGFDFLVAPQVSPAFSDELRTPLDYVIYLIVFDTRHRPVFFVQVNPEDRGSTAERRREADVSMRERFSDVMYACPLPRLYALSILGTHMRVYCHDFLQNTTTPQFVPRGEDSEDYLKGEWPIDILSRQGFSELKRLVGWIRDESKKLDDMPQSTTKKKGHSKVFTRTQAGLQRPFATWAGPKTSHPPPLSAPYYARTITMNHAHKRIPFTSLYMYKVGSLLSRILRY